MNRQRRLLLVGLAILTLIFFGAATYTFLGSPLANKGERTIEPLPLGEVPQALRISVTEPGIVAISAEQLDQSYLPIDVISPDSLFVTRDGVSVPFFVDGEGRDATLYFYAQVVTDTLGAPAVYWLGPGQGEPMKERAASPTTPLSSKGTLTKRWEENEIFLAQASGDDVWLGKLLFAPSSLDIELDNIQPTGGPGELSVRIWSNNQASDNPDHHVTLVLNGQTLTDHYWDGITQETIIVQIPEGLLDSEKNTLTITAPGDTGAAGEALYIDWIELEYEGHLELQDGFLTLQSDGKNILTKGVKGDALVFDISDQDAPVALTELEYSGDEVRFSGNEGESSYYVLNPEGVVQPTITLVPQRQTLTDPGRGADYVAIIANADGFSEAIEPLLDFRSDQGLLVEAIQADQIFDEFGHGRATPEALRDFLTYAVENWEPTPRFALLVGDASYDLHDYTQGKNKNLLPTFLVYTEFAGYVASDTRFTLSDDDSLAPSIALGRFPAQSVDQLETMVEKTLAYEQADGSQWLNRALLVADDEATFDEVSDDLADNLSNTGFQAQKLYMTADENIHDAIVSALNQGVGILNYVGHGSVEVWGDERVFQAEDAEILINGDRLPIFTTFTCLNGYFNHPDVDALAETLIWAEDGGVVASIAPSGRSLTGQQLPLAKVFYDRLLSGDADTLGEALQMAKLAGSDDHFLSDVIHTFNLLGDPALRFQLPSGESS